MIFFCDFLLASYPCILFISLICLLVLNRRWRGEKMQLLEVICFWSSLFTSSGIGYFLWKMNKEMNQVLWTLVGVKMSRRILFATLANCSLFLMMLVYKTTFFHCEYLVARIFWTTGLILFACMVDWCTSSVMQLTFLVLSFHSQLELSWKRKIGHHFSQLSIMILQMTYQFIYRKFNMLRLQHF